MLRTIICALWVGYLLTSLSAFEACGPEDCVPALLRPDTICLLGKPPVKNGRYVIPGPDGRPVDWWPVATTRMTEVPECP